MNSMQTIFTKFIDNYIVLIFLAILTSILIFLSLPINTGWVDGAVYLTADFKSAYPQYPFIYPVFCHYFFDLFNHTSRGIYLICFLQLGILFGAQLYFASVFENKTAKSLALLLLSLNAPLIAIEKSIASEGIFCSILILLVAVLYQYEKSGKTGYLNVLLLLAMLLAFIRHLGIVFLIVPFLYLLIKSIKNLSLHPQFIRTVFKLLLMCILIIFTNQVIQKTSGASGEIMYGRAACNRINQTYHEANEKKRKLILDKWKGQTNDELLKSSIEFIAVSDTNSMWLGPYQKIDSLITIYDKNKISHVYKTPDGYLNNAYIIYLSSMDIEVAFKIAGDMIGMYFGGGLHNESAIINCESYNNVNSGLSNLIKPGELLDPSKKSACNEIAHNIPLRLFNILTPIVLMLLVWFVLRMNKKIEQFGYSICATFIITGFIYCLLHTAISVREARYALPMQVIFFMLLVLLIVQGKENKQNNK